MYVIVKRDGEKVEFASVPGSLHSYTKDLMLARTFKFATRARKECCGNEAVMPIEALLQTPE